MGVNKIPTTKSRALGAALRDAREARGLTLRDFAATIDASPSGLSMWENGKRTPKATDVAKILAVLDIRGERYEEILALASGTDDSSWLAISLPAQRQHLAALLRFERDAEHITAVSPLMVSGPLQTEAYVRSIMTSAGIQDGEIDTRVAVRLGRREVLKKASTVEFIGESALWQQIGNRDIMVDQLEHLVRLAQEVELHVVPFGAGWNPSLEGAWTVIEFREATPVIYLENRRSGLFLHEPDDVTAYREAVDSVREVAMSPEASVELIAEVIDIMRSMNDPTSALEKVQRERQRRQLR